MVSLSDLRQYQKQLIRHQDTSFWQNSFIQVRKIYIFFNFFERLTKIQLQLVSCSIRKHDIDICRQSNWIENVTWSQWRNLQRSNRTV